MTRKRPFPVFQSLALTACAVVSAFLTHISIDTHGLSDQCLRVLWPASLLLGLVFSPWEKDDALNIIAVIAPPMALDYISAVNPPMLWILLLYICVALTVNLIWELFRGDHRKKMWRYLKDLLYMLRIFVGVSLLTGLLVTYISSTLEKERVQKQEAAATVRQQLGGDAGIALLMQFDQRNWYTLSEEEKLSALRQIAAAEAAYLGLPEVPTVQTDAMEDRTALGYYLDGSRGVYIRQSLLTSGRPTELLEVLCHEVFHSYEYRLADLYAGVAGTPMRKLRFLADAAKYKDNFVNYIDSSLDFDGYRNQLVEQHSRDYAAQRVKLYKLAMAYYREEGLPQSFRFAAGPYVPPTAPAHTARTNHFPTEDAESPLNQVKVTMLLRMP